MLRVESSLELKSREFKQIRLHIIKQTCRVSAWGRLFIQAQLSQQRPQTSLQNICISVQQQLGCHPTLPVEDLCTQLLKYSLNKQKVKSLFEKTRNHNFFLGKTPRSYMLSSFHYNTTVLHKASTKM